MGALLFIYKSIYLNVRGFCCSVFEVCQAQMWNAEPSLSCSLQWCPYASREVKTDLPETGAITMGQCLESLLGEMWFKPLVKHDVNSHKALCSSYFKRMLRSGVSMYVWSDINASDITICTEWTGSEKEPQGGLFSSGDPLPVQPWSA